MVQNQTPESTATSNRSSLANVLGITSGLIGSLFALAALTTPILKIAGVLACATIAMVLWQAARDRAHGQLSNALMWQLAAAGVCVLALVVLLGAQTAANPQSPAQDRTADGKPAAVPPNGNTGTASPQPEASASNHAATAAPGGGSAPALPGSVWLSELSPVDGGDGWEPGTAVIDTKRFEHNVVVGTCFDSEKKASYHLARQYQRFTASVGLTEHAPDDAKVKLTVFADKEQVVSKAVGIGEIVTLDVKVAGALRLVMRIEVLGLSACDELNLVLGDAKLIR